MNDLQDIAQGQDLEPTHSIVFETLTDGGLVFDQLTAVRAVDVRELASISDSADGGDGTVLTDLAAAVTQIDSVREWSYDVQDTAAGVDSVSSLNTIVADLSETAECVDSSTADYPLVLVTDTAVAFSQLAGTSTHLADVAETGQGYDRVSLAVSTDATDTAEAVDNVTLLNTVTGDVQELAVSAGELSSVNTATADLQDTAEGTDAVSTTLSAIADLIESAFVFSRVDSSASNLAGGVDPNAELPLGVVYSSDMAWTCNTESFAMSYYKDSLTAGGFTAKITTGRQNFGSKKTKRAARVYMEHEADTALTLTVQADGRGGSVVTSYSVPATESGIGPETQRVKLGRGVAGDRWVFQLEGVEPFTVENFTALISEGVLSHG